MSFYIGLEEEDVGTIIRSLVSNARIAQYERDTAREDIVAAKNELTDLRSKCHKYECEQDTVDGLHCVIDDMTQEINEKEAEIQKLRDENKALEDTVKAIQDKHDRVVAKLNAMLPEPIRISEVIPSDQA